MNNKFIILLFCFLIPANINGWSNNRYKHNKQLASVMYQSRIGGEENDEEGGKCDFNMCEEVPDYPEEQVKEIIDKNTALHSYFGEVTSNSRPVSIKNRFFEGDENVKPLCISEDRKIRPKSMWDINNVPRLIANVDGYKQIINYQVCSSEDQPCSKSSLLNYRTQCKQKYIVIKLVTVNPENDSTEYQPFIVPSTCVCTFMKQTE